MGCLRFVIALEDSVAVSKGSSLYSLEFEYIILFLMVMIRCNFGKFDL